jgi:hypothetical protein
MQLVIHFQQSTRENGWMKQLDRPDGKIEIVQFSEAYIHHEGTEKAVQYAPQLLVVTYLSR